MARSNNTRSTDPFNAGEPDLSGGAEVTGDDREGSSSSSRSSSRGAEEAPTDWSYEGVSTPSSKRTQKKDAERERKRKEQERRSANRYTSSGYSTTRQTAQTQEPAKPRRKRSGCVTILIVVAIYLCFSSSLSFIQGCTSALGNLSSSAEETSEEVCLELVQERLREVDDDEEILRQVADGFDALLIFYTDYDAEDLGLDADAYAEWLISSGLSSNLDESRIYCDDDEGEGSAYFYITGDDYQSDVTFARAVRDYLQEEGLSYYSLEALSTEQLAEIQALYDDFIDDYEPDTHYVSLTLELVDGSWELDEDEFDNEMRDALCSIFPVEVDLEERDELTACAQTAVERLDALSEDEELIAYVAEEFSDYLDLWAHYDAEDLGLDANAYAEWFVGNAWYRIEDAYPSDDTMVVRVELMDCDDEAWDEFCSSVEEYLDEQGVKYSLGQPLTDAQQEHVRTLYDEVIAAYDLEDESEGIYLVLVFRESGTGEWVIDEDDYRDSLESAFAM